MNNNPKISVIIPTYQPKEYIFDCLESVVENGLEQIEVLVIYNGVKNDLFTKITDFCNENNHFRLIYTEKSGVSNARNIGISQSKGEYIAFIDDDDWVSDNYFNGLLA
ncbi:MAG: glycosyltransferase family 2 protein, partial [Flavobacteriaceae bacterium]|nr:glycosyltransferase family 2 protein [Flavobacteriaceae bacterium]